MCCAEGLLSTRCTASGIAQHVYEPGMQPMQDVRCRLERERGSLYSGRYDFQCSRRDSLRTTGVLPLLLAWIPPSGNDSHTRQRTEGQESCL